VTAPVAEDPGLSVAVAKPQPQEPRIAALKKLPLVVRKELLASLPPADRVAIEHDWKLWARPKQLPPPGQWEVWFCLGGRGAGKSRTGAEFVHWKAETMPGSRGALIGATSDDVRYTMVEGEALALDTPIVTPSGWTTIGAIRVGDEVFAANGMPTRVVAVSPIWNDRPCFSLAIDGAQPIVADERHLWVTSDRREREPRRSVRAASIKTTREIADRVTTRNRPDLIEHEIAMNAPLQLPERELPIPPYTLGAWLGDGDTRGHGQFTCHPRDAEIVERIRADGFEVRKHRESYAWGILKIGAKLRSAKLAKAKHIPVDYLRASAAQRLELLRGLMDTDGYVSERGQCAFDNTNAALVASVRELLLTLGFKPGTIQEKSPVSIKHRMMFRLTFTCNRRTPVPFHLRRKVVRCRLGKESAGRLIRAVDSVSSVSTRCIQVLDPSGTFLAGREMVVTHNSGILAHQKPHNPVRYWPAKRLLKWKNGAQARTFTGEEPQRLRGPQHHWGWLDEWAAFKYPKEAWDQFMLGKRLGTLAQACVTTTPKPFTELVKIITDAVDDWSLRGADPGDPILKRLIATVVTISSSYENRGNVSDAWYERTIKAYEGTRLYDQEVLAKILTDIDGALWKMATIEASRLMPNPETGEMPKLPEFKRVVVAVDPAVTSGKHANETGIMVCASAGSGSEKHGYLKEDLSGRYTPLQWGTKAVTAFHEHKADRIVAEANNGGELVKSNIQAINGNVPVKLVNASRGKMVRAEPVAAKSEQGKIHHLGVFAMLESQLTTYTPDSGLESPDRMDAYVWGMTDLLLGKQGAFVVG